MTVISDATGRWELFDPRAPIAYRHTEEDFPDGRWAHLSVPVTDRCTEPYRDDGTMGLVDQMVDNLVLYRSGYAGDAGDRLAAIVSFIAELQSRLPETVFQARDQGYRWDDIAVRLAMVTATARRRYRDYVARRKEMPLDDLD